MVARLARDPNQFLSTIQIGITLAGFLASAVAAVSLAEPLVPLLGFLGEAAEPVAVVVITLVLTYLTLVVGELAPKRIALQRPERWAQRAARPLAVLSTLPDPRPARPRRISARGRLRHRRRAHPGPTWAPSRPG